MFIYCVHSTTVLLDKSCVYQRKKLFNTVTVMAICLGCSSNMMTSVGVPVKGRVFSVS